VPEKKGATPAGGGRAGVANRSGSGGVEPVPFQKKAFIDDRGAGKGESKSAPGTLATVMWTPPYGAR
jgi:hypothetical protein